MTPTIKIHLLRTYYQTKHETVPLVDPDAVQMWLDTHDVRDDKVVELPLVQATFSQLTAEELSDLEGLIHQMRREKMSPVEREIEWFLDYLGDDDDLVDHGILRKVPVKEYTRFLKSIKNATDTEFMYHEAAEQYQRWAEEFGGVFIDAKLRIYTKGALDPIFNHASFTMIGKPSEDYGDDEILDAAIAQWEMEHPDIMTDEITLEEWGPASK